MRGKTTYRCIVRGCSSVFNNPDLRDAHVDRHFKPRCLCPGPCGRWFHSFSDIQKHLQACSPLSMQCANFVQEKELETQIAQKRFMVNPRWWRCPKDLLRAPVLLSDPMKMEFSKRMRMKEKAAAKGLQDLPWVPQRGPRFV